MTAQQSDVVEVHRAEGEAGIVLVCEHASSFIPPELDNLGLREDDRLSHAAWDPGAFAVAQLMSEKLDAALVASRVSRLVYDCNRPPHAPDAMPARSEIVAIPGNEGLDAAARAARAEQFYQPFRAALARTIAARVAPAIVTIHSFTPVFHGQKREVEIGLLHDSDTRLADAMLEIAADAPSDTRRNAPYGPEDGVTHTLKEHAIGAGLLNVMVELRNDLIATAAQQQQMADLLCDWVTGALARLGDAR
jgi:predicted N-formylglutamate amidohydrolase